MGFQGNHNDNGIEMSFAGQITYNSIDINFERAWNSFSSVKKEIIGVNMSGSGVKEILSYFNQDFITAAKTLLTAQEVVELLQWYDYVRNGSTFAFTRDRDLGCVIPFEGKSANTNDETAGTFTRTVGTGNNCGYIDPSTGLLTFITTADIPRYPAGNYGGGILVEGARTNIVIYQGIDHVSWAKTDSSVGADTTETLDPAGGNNADKLTASAGNGNARYDPGVAIGSDDGVFSVYVKCPTATVTGYISLESTTGGELINQAFLADCEWARVQVKYENATPGGNWRVRIKIVISGEIVYVYCPQLEVGADVLFASQPIITSGATNTRNVEKITYPISNIMDKDTGTIGFWVSPEWIYNKHPAACLFWAHDTGDSGRHLSLFVLASGNWEYRIYDGTGAVGKELAPSASALSQNTWNHVVITYDLTISNGMKIYHNGALLSTSTNDPFNAIELGTSFTIGSTMAGASQAFCNFDDFFLRKEVLGASQIKSIYNMGAGLGAQRNYWSSVRLTNPEFNPIRRTGVNKYDFTIEMEEVLT